VIQTKTLSFIWKFIYLTLISLSVLVFLLLLIIRTEWAQGIIAKKATHWLSEKTGTVVSVDRLFLNFSGDFVIEGLYLEDIHQDTLLYSRKLEAGIEILPLFRGEYHISTIEWHGVVANVNRTLPDSSFNFDFIVSAISSKDQKLANEEQSKKSAFPGIEIGPLFFSDINVHYKDAVSGVSVKLALGELHLETHSMDIEKLDFRLKHLSFLNSNIAVFLKNTPASSATVTSGPNPKVSIDECVIQQISFLFQSPDDSIFTDLAIGKMNLRSVAADLQKKEIVLDYFKLSDSRFAQQLPLGTGTNAKDTAIVSSEIWPEWKFQANQIASINNSIKIDQGSRVFMTGNFDPNHVKLDSISFLIQEVTLRNKSAGLNLKALAFQEQCGFRIVESRLNAKLNDRMIRIDSLVLKTENSIVSTSLLCDFTSLETFIQKPFETKFKLSVSPSTFLLKDVVYFSPDLLKTPHLATLSKYPLKMNGQLDGALNSMVVSGLNVNWGTQTYLSASGKLAGLPDIDKLKIDFPKFNLNSGRDDIAGFLPSGEFPIDIPSSIGVEVSVTGSINELFTEARVFSSDGQLDIEGSYANISGQISYSAMAEPQNLNIGNLLRQPRLGKVSGQIALNGRGIDPKTLVASLEADFTSAELNFYTYKNVLLTAKAAQGIANAEITYSDSNLIANLHATGSLDTVKPAYSVVLNLEGANLKGLGLTTDEIRTKFNLMADFEGSLDNFTSKVEISDGLVVKNEKLYPLDSIILKASGSNDSTGVFLKTPFISGMVVGNANPDKIMNAVSNHLKHYFNKDRMVQDSSGTIELKAKIAMKQTEILTDVLIPNLSGFKPSQLDVVFNEKKQSMNADLNVDMLDYNGIKIDSLQFRLRSNPDSLGLVFNYARLKSGPVDMFQTNFTGSVSNESILVSLLVEDSTRQKLFQLISDVNTPGDEYHIHLDPDALILNGESWKIPATNLLVIGNNTLKLTDFELKNGAQELHARTPSDKMDELSIQFDRFEIRNLTSMINPSKVPIQGEIQGELNLKELFSSFGFTTDLIIDSLEVIGNDLGVLGLKASTSEQKQYDLQAGLIGEGINLELKGNYFSAFNASTVEVTFKINEVNTSKIEGFSNGAIRNGKGAISGVIDVKGSPTNPKYTGHLQFNEASFDVSAFNGQFTLSNELISVANEQIVFDRLRITDRTEV